MRFMHTNTSLGWRLTGIASLIKELSAIVHLSTQSTRKQLYGQEIIILAISVIEFLAVLIDK
jgi:hypothetical protein